jgi:hypothetical protein
MARLITAAVTAAALAGLATAAHGADCAYDRKAMLHMDYEAFDEGPQGWRSVAHRDGCKAAAADLLAAYRARQEEEVAFLAWHEGQMRAFAGETDQAIRLFEVSRAAGGHDPEYVDATIAFLKRDKPALLDARRRLAAQPEPPDFAERAARYKTRTGQTITWPMNLHVIDGLIACWDKPYSEAYGCELAKDAAKAG